jgi:hypothetical protein
MPGMMCPSLKEQRGQPTHVQHARLKFVTNNVTNINISWFHLVGMTSWLESTLKAYNSRQLSAGGLELHSLDLVLTEQVQRAANKRQVGDVATADAAQACATGRKHFNAIMHTSVHCSSSSSSSSRGSNMIRPCVAQCVSGANICMHLTHKAHCNVYWSGESTTFKCNKWHGDKIVLQYQVLFVTHIQKPARLAGPARYSVDFNFVLKAQQSNCAHSPLPLLSTLMPSGLVDCTTANTRLFSSLGMLLLLLLLLLSLLTALPGASAGGTTSKT